MIKTFKAKFNIHGDWVEDGKIRVKTRARDVYEITCTDNDTQEIKHWRFVWGLNELHFHIKQIALSETADIIFEYFYNKTKESK